MYELRTLATEALVALGDARSRTFTRVEMERWILEGYRDLCYQVRPLWEVVIYDDGVKVSNYDFDYENDEGGDLSFRGPSTYDFPFEGDYAMFISPASDIDFPVELPYIPVGVGQMVATTELDEKFIQMERVTWDGRRLVPLHSRSLEVDADSLYETTSGDVNAYVMNKDGHNVFRRYRVPAGAGSSFTVVGRRGTIRAVRATTGDQYTPFPRWGFFARMTGVGIIWPPDIGISLSWMWSFRQTTEILTDSFSSVPAFLGTIFSGSRGVFRRFPGMHPSMGSRGLIRSIQFEARNTRTEFQRLPLVPGLRGIFELPDYVMRYVRHYAMSKALRRESQLQDLKMSAHYMGRYRDGVGRLKTRVASTDTARHHILGGGSRARSGGRPPLARLPWNYPNRGGRS